MSTRASARAAVALWFLACALWFLACALWILTATGLAFLVQAPGS